MAVKLENKKWEEVIKTDELVEYDNYVIGFTPFQCEGLKINTLRVVISLDFKKGLKYVFALPWVDGETYTDWVDKVPDVLKQEVKSLVITTDFYKSV